MTGFDNPWYAEILERFRYDVESKDPAHVALEGIGVAILAGCCIVAQAIDGLAEAIKEKRP